MSGLDRLDNEKSENETGTASGIITHVLGCKVNYADVQKILAGLPEPPRSPLALVGTCCVTAEGEKQSRKEVRRAMRRVGQSGTVLVTGCAARRAPEAFADLGENVEVLTGDLDTVAARAAEMLGNESGQDDGANEYDGTLSTAGIAAPRPRAGHQDRTRFFLKVQDGCGNGCAYCVIPSVRGRPVSLPMDEILTDAAAALGSGYQEIVVTGINVGAWREGDFNLSRLLESLAGLDGLVRLRLSSIEAGSITGELIKVIRAYPVIGRHLHLPLQSGDDGILKAMWRRYDRALFAQSVEAMRRAVPEINLTTDVIAGFPGEDAAAFENTLSFVEEMRFSKVHVFTYSPRPGTGASAMGDPVPATEKRRRSRLLRELSDRLLEGHRKGKLGEVSEVLLESPRGSGAHGGYSSDYTRFVVKGGKAGDLVRARAEAVTEEGVTGRVVANG